MRNRYDNLKKIIYQVEKDLVAAGASNDLESGSGTPYQGEPNERSGLLSTGARSQARAKANNMFLPALDRELEKIMTFYFNKERELYSEVEALASDIEFVENFDLPITSRLTGSGSKALSGSVRRTRSRNNSRASRHSTLARSGSWRYDEALALANAAALKTAAEVSQDADHIPNPPSSSTVVPGQGGVGSSSQISNSMATNVEPETPRDEDDEDDEDDAKSMWFDPEMEHEKMRFRHNCIEMFVNLSELQAYAKLNCTGFSKILKKYDKISDNNTKKVYMNQVVLQAYPFKQETTEKLQAQIDRVRDIYARIFTNGDIEVAKRSLKMHLKEHMVWERNTVWRDMIGIERKSQAVGVRPSSASKTRPITINTPFGSIEFPEWLTHDVWTLLFCCLVFAVLLHVELFEGPEQQNCFAILVFASLLWATEVKMTIFFVFSLVPESLSLTRPNCTFTCLSPQLPCPFLLTHCFSFFFPSPLTGFRSTLRGLRYVVLIGLFFHSRCLCLSHRCWSLCWWLCSESCERTMKTTLDWIRMPPPRKSFHSCFPQSSCCCSGGLPSLQP